MKALLTATILFVPLAAFAQTPPPTPFGLSGLRVAFFSPERAFSESEEGKAGIARLKTLQEKGAREIDARNKALQSKEEVQKFIQEAQAEFLGVQREIESAFTVRLRPAVELVAKEKKLQLILSLDTETFLWVDPSLDITADVVKQLARTGEPAKPRFE